MRVKTFGSFGARSASASTTQSATGWRAFLRIQTTSNAVHAAAPARTSSIGRMPRLRPPASGGAVDDDGVTAAGLGDERRLSTHFIACLHRAPVSVPVCTAVGAADPCESRHRSVNAVTAVMHLALCSAIWNAYACSRATPFPPSALADAFLHSPPMVESSARSTRPRLFLPCRDAPSWCAAPATVDARARVDCCR